MSQTEQEIPFSALSNAPFILTSFIGRKREIEEVLSLLRSSRLVTLTGAAGCGKTRLALQVTTQAGPLYADGTTWVDLTRLMNPRHAVQALAKTLPIAGQPGRPLIESLLAFLQNRRMLILLDNCEHVSGACRRLVQVLLRAPGVSFLATSREPLGLPGERRYPLMPLACPKAGLPLEELRRVESVRLFVERARAILPGFDLTHENAEQVSCICRHLEGLPLAIELASARVNVLSVQEIAARLGLIEAAGQDREPTRPPRDPLALLEAVGGSAGRYPSLRAALDWSYGLLNPGEQALLRRLSVFVGAFSLAAVENVCALERVAPEQILPLMNMLVEKSLVVAQTLQAGEARYRLLVPIRQYLQEKIAAAGEWAALRERHLRYYLDLTGELDARLNGPYQQLWLDWLENEYGNIRAALSWALEAGRQQDESLEAGLRIAIAIYPFWTIRDYVDEGLGWMERLLKQTGRQISPLVRSNACAYAAFLAGFRGKLKVQAAYGLLAEGMAEEAGEAGKPALRWALAAQAYGARAAGNFQTEFSLGQRVIALNRELADTYQLGLTLSIYSFSAMALGEYPAARAMLEEALPLLRETGSPYRIAMALNYAGDLARCERDDHRAKTAYEESIALLRELNAPRDLASALKNLAHVCLRLKDRQSARALFDESLAIQIDHHNHPGIAECLIGYAALALAQNLPYQAARLLGAADTLGAQTVIAAWAATRMEYQDARALLHGGLSTSEVLAGLAAGKALSPEQAAELALSLPQETLARVNEKSDQLTVRERQVATLVAQGLSNEEIANVLVVSKRTVEKHIANIRSKLEMNSRAQMIHWAIDAGLMQANHAG